jgi:hypothetical protein
MNVAISWDVVPCSSYVKGHFEGIYHLHLRRLKSAKQQTSVAGRWQYSFNFRILDRRNVFAGETVVT